MEIRKISLMTSSFTSGPELHPTTSQSPYPSFSISFHGCTSASFTVTTKNPTSAPATSFTANITPRTVSFAIKKETDSSPTTFSLPLPFATKNNSYAEKKMYNGPLFTPSSFRNPIKRSIYSIMSSRKSIKAMTTRKNIESNTNNIPTKIDDTFDKYYNINSCHQRILQILVAERENKKVELTNMLEQLQHKIVMTQDKEKRRKWEENFNEIKKEQDYVCTGLKLQEYQQEVKNILEQFVPYAIIGCKENSFVSSNKDSTNISSMVDKEKDDIRLSLTYSFVEIAKKYVDINVTQVKQSRNVCNICNQSLSDLVPDDRGMIYCLSCGTEKRYVKEIYYHQQVEDIFTTSKGKKESDLKVKKTKSDVFNINNFKKMVDLFQGRISCRNYSKENLIADLNSYFKKKKIPSCEETQLMTLDIRGRRGQLKMTDLFDCFHEIGHSDYCDDGSLIAHLALGWKLPDLSHYEERIYDVYQKIQKGLQDIKDKGRSSNLGRHYLLFKILELVGYPCNYFEDLKVNKMKETLSSNEELWSKACELANDEDIYFIPTL